MLLILRPSRSLFPLPLDREPVLLVAEALSTLADFVEKRLSSASISSFSRSGSPSLLAHTLFRKRSGGRSSTGFQWMLTSLFWRPSRREDGDASSSMKQDASRPSVFIFAATAARGTPAFSILRYLSYLGSSGRPFLGDDRRGVGFLEAAPVSASSSSGEASAPSDRILAMTACLGTPALSIFLNFSYSGLSGRLPFFLGDDAEFAAVALAA
mmetsp:Transcript_522/g.1879  ORF Transcript_522/g.1879 Transcript_522/m.1879 type:complete len:212 (-) Transcript_522:1649-2284(-)